MKANGGRKEREREGGIYLLFFSPISTLFLPVWWVSESVCLQGYAGLLSKYSILLLSGMISQNKQIDFFSKLNQELVQTKAF